MSKVSLRILTLREQRVVLDSDLARIYGVTTGRFNEAVKRNLRTHLVIREPVRCQRFGEAPRREERAYPVWICKRRATPAQRQRSATLRAKLWRAIGGVAPQSQNATAMLPRRALPVARQSLAHPFPNYEMGSKRFPTDFSFVVTREEYERLISQNAISKPGRGGRTKLPRVFTEHGALMAAGILNSERAITMSVYVIRAFVDMRETLATNAAILKRLAEIDKTLVLHGTALSDIYQKLLPLLSPSPNLPRRQIGFTQ